VLSGRPALFFRDGAGDENHEEMTEKIEAKTMTNKALQLSNLITKL